VEVRHLTTACLRLDAVVPDDLDEHYALMSDPGVWAHLPSGRHTSPERTAEAIHSSVGHWGRDGLGYWTARLLVDLAGTPDPDAVRLVYADRPVDDALIAEITALG
jgi:RimJ/RimL family protein N-acetyltransferase